MSKKSSDTSWRKFKKINLKPVDKKAQKLEKRSLKHAHKFVISRWSNLSTIRRHVVGWLILVAILCSLAALQAFFNYRSIMAIYPSVGGVYAEGMVGSFRNINPLFATNEAELSANRLIFSGLLRYDADGKLQPDLAESWRVEDKGKKYIVTLRPDLVWHDGTPITSADVIFTIKTIQNPRVNAVMRKSWAGIEAKAINKQQISFELSNAYAPFAATLTTAILPQHILSPIKPESIEEHNFGSQPIGSGPFRFVSYKPLDINNGKSLLQLSSFEDYWQGQPKVNRFSITTYGSENDLLKGLLSHEINAANDLSVNSMNKLDKHEDFIKYNPALNSGMYAFLKTDSEQLKDASTRQALVASTDTASIQKKMLGQNLPGPIINSQLVKSSRIAQAKLDHKNAALLFEKAGWKKNKDGKLQKDGKILTLKVAAVNTKTYHSILNMLAEQWEKQGISVVEQFVDPEQIQQSVLQPRDYDVLVYELEIGGDPDSYAYWHSSQGSISGLNFSNYNSSTADDSLVSARLRSDYSVRDDRYESFAKQWVIDAPAIALYRSTLHYATASQIVSMNDTKELPLAIDRYNTVLDWAVKSETKFNTP